MDPLAAIGVDRAFSPCCHTRAGWGGGNCLPGSARRTDETDEYTRYELLAPETASFEIYYEVAATTAGATYFYN